MTKRQLELHGIVDYHHLQIKKLKEFLSRPVSPLEQLIDDAIGMSNTTILVIKEHFKCMIDAKNELRGIEPDNPMYDTTATQKTYDELCELLKNNHQ